MQWIKAFHVIAMVTWFAGLFYLPRLYVYHAMPNDFTTIARFKVMEHKLYYYITTPGGVLTILFGLLLWLPHYAAYSHAWWLHIKLVLVGLLIIFHIYCGYLLHLFKQNRNSHSEKFYRWLNEFPTIILISVVILTIVKPF